MSVTDPTLKNERVGKTLQELADAVGGRVQGSPDVVITGVASISEAAKGDIVLAESERFMAQAGESDASAVLAAGAFETKPVIVVDNPRRAFIRILEIFAPDAGRSEPGVDPTAHVGERVTIGIGASVGYGCWIGDGVTIGDDTVVHPLSYIGEGVRIGAQSVVHPRVTIYRGCEIGSRVIVHSGTVIGADGFGYQAMDGGIVKVPQIGIVVVEDDVEIGANAAIDRAKTGATRIGRGTKIDNLVHIAHNVKTGQSCVIVAQVGIAGSVRLGNGVTIAGQAGVKDQVSIGDGAVVAARAGVAGDLAAGGQYSGFPARPGKEFLRSQVGLSRLPELQKTVRQLQEEIEELKKRLDQLGGE